MSDLKKTAVLGGSFNPVHKGHINTALEAIKELSIDRLILIPNASPPHKDTVSLSFDIRVSMLQLAIEEHSNIEISYIEKDCNVKHYTYNTLCSLKGIYKDSRLYFIMGTDSLYNLHTWYKGFELIKLASLICVNRNSEKNTCIEINESVEHFIREHTGSLSTSCDSNRLHILHGKAFDISSSTIRQAFKDYHDGNPGALDPVAPYMHKKVFDYIIKNRLYA